eukprot:11176536-Lingulodinium_polyedra.AAC.1
MRNGGVAVGAAESARNRRNLYSSVDRLALLRRVGVSRLETHASDVIWRGVTVAKLCTTVSGWSFKAYLAQVRQNH